MTDLEHLIRLYNRKRYAKLIRESMLFVLEKRNDLPQGWGTRRVPHKPDQLFLFEGIVYRMGRVNIAIDIDKIVHRAIWSTSEQPPKIIEEASCRFDEWRIELLPPEVVNHIGRRLGELVFLLLPKEMITVTKILSCENNAVQSHLIMKYGDKEFFSKLNPTVVHQDGESQLLRITINRIEIMMVKVVDTTTKQTYLLRVPPRVPVTAANGAPIGRIRAGITPGRFERQPMMVPLRTCKQAIAWTFGMKAS